MSKMEQKRRDKEVTRAILRMFWKANFQQKWSLALAYITRAPAFTLTNVILPLYVSYGIQSIITRHFNEVNHYAWVLFFLSVLVAILIAIGAWAISLNGTSAGAYVQRQVFANYLNKDYDFYNNTFYGALGAQAARLRDAVTEYGRLVTLDIPRQVVIIVASLVILAFQAPLLAVVTLFCMTFVLSYTIISSTWRLKFRRDLSEVSSEVAGVIGDSLTHSATVKSFAAEKYEQDRLEPTLKRWMTAQYRSWLSSIPSDMGRNIMAAVTMGIMLIVTAKMYEQNRISIAIVALVQFYVVRMINVTYDIAETIKAYEVVMGSAYQPVSTMLIEPTVFDKPKTRPIAGDKSNIRVTFDNVTYRYDESAKKAFAVKDFKLDITSGQKVGLVGYSGSGKTTLTKLLLRFIDVSDGQIMVNGVDIRDLSQSDLRRLIAYVPQEPLLFHRSIGENISYGNPDASQKSIVAAAKASNVEEFVGELPKGYDTLVGERGVKLSGGQRQRVAIARAILKYAPILVLD
jgi:ATP-binding cassette subfamily B protein